MLTPHPIYIRLDSNEQERQLECRGLFAHQIEGKLLMDIRQAINKGLTLGSDSFLLILKALQESKLLKASEADL